MKPHHPDCDSQALRTAQGLILNPTQGRTAEELETAQAVYRLYNSLRYGFKAMLTAFANDRQYLAVKDQLPSNPRDGAPDQVAAYKEARKRLIYNPVKVVIEEYMQQELQSAGTEAEFLKHFNATSEQTMKALIDRLLDTAVERYWLELQLNPESDRRQPEMIKVRVVDGRPVDVTAEEKRKHMRQCLLRLNEEELRLKQRLNQKFQRADHADTIIGQGGYVGQPGASNYIITDTQGGRQDAYCILLLDFETCEWECLARVSSQQESFRYADAQRRAAEGTPGILIRAFRDAQTEFPLGQAGRFANINPKWYKPLQIPHLQPRTGEAPLLSVFPDSKVIEGTRFWDALQQMVEQEKAKYHALNAQTNAEVVTTA